MPEGRKLRGDTGETTGNLFCETHVKQEVMMAEQNQNAADQGQQQAQNQAQDGVQQNQTAFDSF